MALQVDDYPPLVDQTVALYTSMMGWRGGGGLGGGPVAVSILATAELDAMTGQMTALDRALLLWCVRKFHGAAMDLIGESDGA